MANWTAITGITGIVVSGAVGPWLSARWAVHRGEREHEHDRVLADRAELRALLDEGEQAMLVGERIASLAPMQLETRSLRPQPQSDQHIEFHEALREIDRQGGRLTLRLGRDAPAATAYREAFNALLRIDAALSHHGTNVVISDADHEQRQLNARRANNDATVAHDEFLSLATALVASQLEPRRPAGAFDRTR